MVVLDDIELRVGARAHEHPLEAGGDFADDREVAGGDLFADGGKVAFEEGRDDFLFSEDHGDLSPYLNRRVVEHIRWRDESPWVRGKGVRSWGIGAALTGVRASDSGAALPPD